jgi:hypothetical protein
LSILQILSAILLVAALLLASSALVVSRLGYIRTHARIRQARRIWWRYLIAQECRATVLAMIGIGGFPITDNGRVAAAIVATGAFFLYIPMEPAGFDVPMYRFERLCQHIVDRYGF